MPLRIERKGGIRKKSIGNDLSVAGRQQPGAAPRRLDAGADDPPAAAMSARGKRGIRNGKPLPGSARRQLSTFQ
jgi:hypothetical protein